MTSQTSGKTAPFIMAFQKFRMHEKKGIFKMKDVNSWLIDHVDQYSKIKSNRIQHNIHPSLFSINMEDLFLSFFEALQELSELHQDEKYFQKEVEFVKNIEDDIPLLKRWLIKNEDLGSSKFVCFEANFLDYSDDVHHLNVYVHKFDLFEIYVNRDDFKYTIAFLNIFNHLYWEKKLLPESLAKLDQEIEKIRINKV